MDTKAVRKALRSSTIIPGSAQIKAAYVAGATAGQIAKELGHGKGYILSIVRSLR